MSLKKQLLVVGALTLLIPLAGVQFVLELEDALRAQELSRLNEQGRRIAAAIEPELAQENVSAGGRTLFVETFSRQLILDGYGDDWPNKPGEDGVPLLYPAGDQVLWRAAESGDSLWLFLEFPGLKPVLGQAGEGLGASESAYRARDRLILSWRAPGSVLQERLIEAPAPGRATVRRFAPAHAGAAGDPSILAFWQSRSGGSTVELQMPALPPGSRLGFSLEHAPGAGPAQTFGSLGRKTAAPAPAIAGSGSEDLPLLLRDRPSVDAALSRFLTPGQSLTLVSPEGWQLARADAPIQGQAVDVSLFSPLELLQQATLQGLRLLLSLNQESGPELTADGARWRGEPLQQLQTTPAGLALEATHQPGEPPALTAIVPVATDADGPQAYLISQRSTEALLSLSSATLGQVLSRSMLLTLMLVLALVGYASWLSWRISRLRTSVDGLFDSEGRITGVPMPSNARDELGELSRNFAHLVGQVRGYTQYLESFARKLSHELKTPLAVMRSSLDNLSHTDPSPEQSVYLERASEGGERLSRILTAMSEASRLERSLTRTEKEAFDLAAVLEMAAEGYRGLDDRIVYQGLEGPCPMLGAPDLLVQALDKLVENARDFTPPTGRIVISLTSNLISNLTSNLTSKEPHWLLSVCNDGPLLPAQMGEHIFDSFVSIRQPGADDGHLGQGLVIVKLVADFHYARVQAENRPDDAGVCFRLFLPRHPTQSA